MIATVAVFSNKDEKTKEMFLRKSFRSPDPEASPRNHHLRQIVDQSFKDKFVWQFRKNLHVAPGRGPSKKYPSFLPTKRPFFLTYR